MKKNQFSTQLSLCFSLAVTPVFAADLTWDNGSADGLWNTTSENWSGAGIVWNNTTPDNAIFGGVGAGTVTLSEPITVGNITITSAYTITGDTLTINGGTIDTSGTSDGSVVNIDSIIDGTGELTIASNGSTADSGGGVGGSTRLGGANTFVGAVRITSGVVDMNSNFGDAGNVVILDGGGLVDKNLNVNFTRDIQVGAGGGVLRNYGGVSNNIIAGSISNESGVASTSLKHTDGGTIKLAGDGSGFTGDFNNVRGNVHVTGLDADWSGTHFNITSGSMRVNGGGVTTINELTTGRDVHVEANNTLDVAGGTVNFMTGRNFWVQNSGEITSSSGTLTINSGGAASGNLTTNDQQLKLDIVDFDGSTPLAVVKNNVNQLVLDQPNTYSGGTTINAGRINANHVSAFGTGEVTVNDGGQAFLTQGGTYNNDFSINGLGATEGAGTLGAIRFGNNTIANLEVASASRVVGYTGASGTISGDLTGSGDLEINFAGNANANGTITLQGTGATYTGTVTVSGGRFNMGTALGGSLVVADGATLGDEGSVAGSLTLGATTGANLIVDPGTASVLAVGGDVTLNGVTNLSFATVPQSGTVDLLSYVGTLTDGNGGDLTDSFSVTNSSDYRSVAVTDNSKTLVLDLGAESSTWTGATSDVWEQAGTTATNWTSSDNLFYRGDAVTFDDTATGTTAINVASDVAPASMTFNNSSKNYSLSGTGISGDGVLTKGGTGELTISNDNTFSGGVVLNAGTLNLNSAGALGSGTFTVNGGSIDNTSGSVLTLNTGNAHAWDADVTFVGSNDLNTGSGTITLNGDRQINVMSGTLTVGGNLTGGSSLTKTGDGTLVLAGGGSWSGATTVAAGTMEITANPGAHKYTLDPGAALKLGYSRTNAWGGDYGVAVHGNGVADASGLYLKGGTSHRLAGSGGLNFQTAASTVRTYDAGTATLMGGDINGVHLTLASAASGSVIDSNVTLNAANYGYRMEVASGANNATGDLVINGDMNGSGSVARAGIDVNFHKRGAGSILINGATSYAEGMWIRQGAVILGGHDRLPITTGLAFGDGGTSGKLVMNGYNQTLSDIGNHNNNTGSSIVNGSATASTLTVNYTGDGRTFAGILGGAGSNENNLSLVKSGSGDLTLSGTNTYTGKTSIDEGLLSLGVSGSIAASSEIEVSAGATFDVSAMGTTFELQNGQTLGGAGQVLGPIQLASGSVLAPGSSAGTLTMNSSLMLGTGSFLDFELSGSDQTNGSNINDLVAGITDLTLDGTLNVTELVTNDFLNAQSGDRWVLMEYSGTLTDNGLDLGTLPTLTAGLDFELDITTGGQVALTVIPEPSTFTLFGLGAFALILRRKR
ncbi:autotransporter-associated beta strand repeat-containing protein [Verrucomicrobiaceae bacterium N1E253]|uniref:Autotransporter-associated beta strand repeat-containing protein n=1 Tax=Oceaniferula marina TaxID=2748318 RepID=A0A851GN04_9BACT|nr:autotransporter-associated beta strand repeat-containing protein [Oceaniferula marina]NWK56515.1 autotransporter-associated beta strand repeat-containing protein [Oceaniferula marina]